jgi:membrane peptidoglycan carboxypeptidase
VVSRRRGGKRATRRAIPLFLVFLGVSAVLYIELAWTSGFQARYFASAARAARFALEFGPSPSIRFPEGGPFDERLGYVRLPAYLERLQSNGFEITRQARWSPGLSALADKGLFPPYREKIQAGLRLLDRNGEPLLGLRYPERSYRRFEEIPPPAVETLLFIENRELLNEPHPTRNPAVEPDRLARAALDQAIHWADSAHDRPGGSTLATQMEKYRHSPNGRTDSITEKVRQMMSASLRAYRTGEDTLDRRREIVLDYLNTVPLGGRSGWGEVHGLGDGLLIWYGREPAETTRLLTRVPADEHELAAAGLAYKQVLSLLIAQRRPSLFLSPSTDRLEALSNAYLRVLAGRGIISPSLRDAALEARLHFRPNPGATTSVSFGPRKGTDAIRTQLAMLLDTPRRYDLDRLDLTVGTTLDGDAQEAASKVLRALRDPKAVRAAGLVADKMLARGDPSKVVYSVTLWERTADAFVLRVHADNLDQPFDVNDGLKLDLGSTAKLRTLVSYLEVVAELHGTLSALDATVLKTIPVEDDDALRRWAIDYLSRASDRSLSAMLAAALERQYSANPGERFFTGGGLHTFENFRREDDHRVASVRVALRDSLNLPFVRIMRDVARYYSYRDGRGAMFRNPTDPRRAVYLARFADQEGRVFVERFYRDYDDLPAAEIEARLLKRMRPTPHRLAAVFRSIAPELGSDELHAFFSRAGVKPPAPQALNALYEQYSPSRLSLVDRAYVAGLHPLELWMAAYLREHPGASFGEVLTASARERQEVYQWLIASPKRAAQDRAIRIVLETEAFAEIHRGWQRVGYPFDTLVPSYATALGSSADRPAALAELMGTIVANGVRLPTKRITQLHFAAATPYETVLDHRPARGEQVMAPEVAAALHGVLAEVVSDGTARRLRGIFQGLGRPNAVVGGKTGTGDHRFKVIGPNGATIESRSVNRAATFVFFTGDRFFGTITAYVAGPAAAGYNFTSALPVQILKVLEPALRPLVAPIEAPAVDAQGYPSAS